ncbi:MAG: AAA family ATPase [Verrucomicrobia bacterium]|nr:AAA family ATPase [Verrucomicrobiota bacterium]
MDRISDVWLRLKETAVSDYHGPLLTGPRPPLFRVNQGVCLRMDDLVTDHRAHLVHGSREKKSGSRRGFYWEELIFELDGGIFVRIKRFGGPIQEMAVWAPDMSAAEQLALDWARRYRRRISRRLPTEFYILRNDEHGVRTQGVVMKQRAPLDNPELALHYGVDFPAWQREFLDQLATQDTGVAVFSGPPGTGKTSFIRYLINRLKATMRFYFLPTNEFHLISNPSLVRFWLEDEDANPRFKRMLIVEDAEALLAPRNASNGEHVSTLLNMADGLLGDFLKLQMICTVNCRLDALDPALLRPGRLLAYREFHRLNAGQARLLAESKQINLPPQADYSLAEIYCKKPTGKAAANGHRIGF